MLDKLHRELDRYREVAGRDEEDLAAMVELVDQLKDSAFNAAVTAWHLGDWVFKDMTADQRKALGVRSLGDLQAHGREKCRALYLCRYAATASKHSEVNTFRDPKVEVVVSCEEDAGWSVHFVDDGNTRAADQVFSEALDFWTGFIFENHIGK
ncbi:hypothetical protein [Bradyrhizobium sp. F1.13.3]|uniref:hypothetical protein n=1 Tax=Bradyrhizobium sp. F1.13.3 TaxID=3156351 RepID=UPI003390A47F